MSARPAPPGGAPWRLTWGGGEGRGRPGPPCHSLVGPDPLAVGSLASGVCRRVGPGALRSSSVVMPPPSGGSSPSWRPSCQGCCMAHALVRPQAGRPPLWAAAAPAATHTAWRRTTGQWLAFAGCGPVKAPVPHGTGHERHQHLWNWSPKAPEPQALVTARPPAGCALPASLCGHRRQVTTARQDNDRRRPTT